MPPLRPLPRRPQKKKALLIGIRYEEGIEDLVTLVGPHQDAIALKKTLVANWEYREADVTVMLDLKCDATGYNPDLVPSRENILREIDRLVDGAQPEDHFVFHYSGHSKQIPNDDGSEEDDLDEVIIAVDGQIIIDNELKERLVDPLPARSHLVAIFDTCHSQSMLDLPHFRCNSVWVPWISKGIRNTLSFMNRNVRRDAIIPALPSKRTLRIYDRRSMKMRIPARMSIDVLPGKGGQPTRIAVKSRSLSLTAEKASTEAYHSSPIQRCMSPEQILCDGYCPKHSTADTNEPQVVSLSAAKDSQLACEAPDGKSMTMMLIQSMEKNPHLSLKDTMTHISHTIHGFYLRIHEAGSNWKRCNRKFRGSHRSSSDTEPVLETDNFQDPQVSSLHPLNMDEPLRF